jgi:hypothetical protein
MLNRGKFMTTSSRTDTSDSVGGGITVDCGRTCLEMGGDCPAYSVDYAQVWFPISIFLPYLTSFGKLFMFYRAVALNWTGTVKAGPRN